MTSTQSAAEMPLSSMSPISPSPKAGGIDTTVSKAWATSPLALHPMQLLDTSLRFRHGRVVAAVTGFIGARVDSMHHPSPAGLMGEDPRIASQVLGMPNSALLFAENVVGFMVSSLRTMLADRDVRRFCSPRPRGVLPLSSSLSSGLLPAARIHSYVHVQRRPQSHGQESDTIVIAIG